MSSNVVLNAFIGRLTAPDDAALAAVLKAKALRLWSELIATLEKEQLVTSWEWYSYSPKKAGWSLRMKRGKRTIVYLSPMEGGGFCASFVLGKAALKAAEDAGLPDRAVEILKDAPKYPEGTGVRLDVAAKEDLATVLTFARSKVAH
jgi:hypothetical protein